MDKRLTRKALDDKYEELYYRAKQVLKTLNPCNIHKDITGNTICNGMALGCVSNAEPNSLCCNAFGDEPTCQYLSKNGCTVKSLRCKLWICSERVMTPLKSGLWPDTTNVMGPTEAHPNRNYFLGPASFPFISLEHKMIYDEAKRYRFLRFFRQGKTVAVNYAYATRDRIVLDEPKSEALTPDEYSGLQHKEVNEHFKIIEMK